MANTHVVLNVHGGIVQDVFVSDHQCTVLLVDWDAEDCHPDDGLIFQVPKDDGGHDVAHVARFSTVSMARLAWTDIERALRAAGVDLTDSQ